jgi:hypothetical protein
MNYSFPNWEVRNYGKLLLKKAMEICYTEQAVLFAYNYKGKSEGYELCVRALTRWLGSA